MTEFELEDKVLQSLSLLGLETKVTCLILPVVNGKGAISILSAVKVLPHIGISRATSLPETNIFLKK